MAPAAQERYGITVKQIKKWSFLILLMGFGLVYLSWVDHWGFYTETYGRVKQFCRSLFSAEEAHPGELSPSFEGDAPGGTQAAGAGEGEPEGQTPGDAPDGQEQTEGATGGPESTEQTGNSHVTEEGFWDGSEPAYMTVEDDYFSDAVFIGDSRTVGMFEYGGLEQITTFYASKGLTIYKLFDSRIVDVPGQLEKQTIEEALSDNRFRKIYLMVGINEMGTGTVETFAAKYGEVVNRLLELQPDAILYIQAILKVTTERSAQGDYINNEGIEARNEAISQLADNKRVFYLDANPAVCDETGGMEPSYTFDGVHLKAQYIGLWKEYLKAHAIALSEE